jgi:hypothetical protein
MRAAEFERRMEKKKKLVLDRFNAGDMGGACDIMRRMVDISNNGAPVRRIDMEDGTIVSNPNELVEVIGKNIELQFASIPP